MRADGRDVCELSDVWVQVDVFSRCVPEILADKHAEQVPFDLNTLCVFIQIK